MGKNTKLIVIGATAAVLLLGVLWYTQRPSRVVASSITELAQAKTADFVATLQLENAAATQQLLGEQGTVTITLDGSFAREDQARDTIAADIGVVTKTDSVSVNIDGEVRFIGDQAFLYIEKTPPIFGALTQLKGQWLQFPRGGVDQEQPVAVDAPLFNSVDRVGVRDINGKRVVVYQAIANETAVVSMMDNIAQLMGTNLTQQQVEEIRQSVQGVTEVPVEVAVARWGNDLQQLSAVLAIPGGNTVRFTLQINEMNQPVEVAAPEQAVPIDQAVNQALTTTPTPAQ